MKSFNKLMAVVFMIAAFIFIGMNLYWHNSMQDGTGRMYRVEAARLARDIRQVGYGQLDLSGCRYVTHVAYCAIDGKEYGTDDAAGGIQTGFFDDTDSDYLVRQIDSSLYRFDYTASPASDGQCLVAVNLAFVAMFVLLLAVLFYIRRNIIKPFEAFKEVPYELSRGNLAAPVPENQGHFFGRFLWGVDLLREHMEEQKKRELELQRAQKTLVLSVSHDIKTPLSAIKLYAKVISNRLYLDATQLDEIAGNIDAKADEIGMFVTQMAKASSEDFLDLEVVDEGFYLSELVGKTASYYSDKLPLLQTEFAIGQYPDCILKGDLDRSIEVLQNIMENAIKYGDGRKIAITFTEEDDCILATIQNSGCTLQETELPHIFDSFWRGSNTGSSQGSGLGLYICRQLMHRMGGEIFAQVRQGDMCVTAVFRK